MPEQIPEEHPIPEDFDPDQIAAEEANEEPEYFLALTIGKLSVSQAEIVLRRFGPDGQVAMSRYALAKYFGVSENAIRDAERGVWQRLPGMEPEPTPVAEYKRHARGPRDKAPRDRQESYSLGEVEVSLSEIETRVMSLRYNSEGRIVAEQKDVAQQLGMSQGNLSKIERRVLNEFPELASIVAAVKATESAKAAERKKARRRKPGKEAAVPESKIAKEKKSAPSESPADPKYDAESYTAGIDLKNLYDVSKPLNDED